MSDPLAFAVDLDAVRTRLLAMGHFLSVTNIMDAGEEVAETSSIPPAAYVSVASETAEPNKLINGHRQRVAVTLSILFVESTARFDREADDVLEKTRKAVIRCLLGWLPPRAQTPLNYQRYLLRAIGNGLVWGEVLFTTSYFVSTDVT